MYNPWTNGQNNGGNRQSGSGSKSNGMNTPKTNGANGKRTNGKGDGNQTPYTLYDLLQGKDLEIIAASLLLLGKLKVDNVQLFRNSPVINVQLVGAFQNESNSKADAMAEFLEKNGDMTLDDVFDGITKRLNRKKGNGNG